MLELVGNLRIHGFASHWMKRRVSPRPQKHGHQGYAKYHADHGANPHPERDAALRRIGKDAVAITGHELVQDLPVRFARDDLGPNDRAHIVGQPGGRVRHRLTFAHRALQLKCDAAHAVVEGIGVRQRRCHHQHDDHEAGQQPNQLMR